MPAMARHYQLHTRFFIRYASLAAPTVDAYRRGCAIGFCTCYCVLGVLLTVDTDRHCCFYWVATASCWVVNTAEHLTVHCYCASISLEASSVRLQWYVTSSCMSVCMQLPRFCDAIMPICLVTITDWSLLQLHPQHSLMAFWYSSDCSSSNLC
jgi:hypothetical protein